MVNCNMIQNDGDEVVDGPVVSEGGRSPSTLSPGQSAPATRGGAALGPLAPNQRWSAARQRGARAGAPGAHTGGGGRAGGGVGSLGGVGRGGRGGRPRGPVPLRF